MKYASPFAREGREVRPAIFAELMNRCALENGFSFPILAVHGLPKGPLAAILYRDAGREGEVIADFPERMNAVYPVRTIYVELSNFRSVQFLLTEHLWQRARRESAANSSQERSFTEMFSAKIEPMGRHRDAKVTEPGSEDGIPAEMCRNCGAPDEQHENASECVAYWRDRTAKLDFRLACCSRTKGYSPVRGGVSRLP
jgi:hypothetical protein